MGMIKDNKKFERTKTQDQPLNPEIDRKKKDFDIDNKNIIDQKEKK